MVDWDLVVLVGLGRGSQ